MEIVKAVFVIGSDKKTIRVSGTNVKALKNFPSVDFEEGKLEILQDRLFVPFHSKQSSPVEVANDILVRASRNEIASGKEQSMTLLEIKSMHKVFSDLLSYFSKRDNIVMVKHGRNIPNQILTDYGYAVLVAATDDTLYYQDENLEGVMVDMKTGVVICNNDGLVQGFFDNDLDEKRFIYENPAAKIHKIMFPKEELKKED